MSEYRTIVSITILDRTGRGATLARTVVLPFPPALGIEFGWVGARRDEFWSGSVETIVWEDAVQAFHVEMEDWTSSRLALTEMIAELGPEWKVISRAA